MVFEPVEGGHHLQYVRMLADALREHVSEVVIVLREHAPKTDEFRVHLAGLRDPKVRFGAEVAFRQGSKSLEGHALESVLALRHSIRQYRPDRVYLPYADGIVQMLGAVAPLGRAFMPRVPIEALIMRGGFAYPAARSTRRLRHEVLFELLANSKVHTLHVLDPLVFADLARRSRTAICNVSPIPEPVEPLPSFTRQEARRQLGVPEDGRYIVCAGALDARKGLDLLLHAAVAAGLPNDARILLVGRVSSEMRALHTWAAGQLGDRMITIDRYVSDAEFDLAVLAADVVAVPYPSHQGSSGLLVRALAAGRYLLSSDYGWVGWVTQTLGAGVAADVRHTASLSRALDRALSEATTHRLGPLATRFVAYHTAENQRAHWTSQLRKIIGGSGDVPMTWEEVIRGSAARASDNEPCPEPLLLEGSQASG